ncbi:Spo0J Stage 0 sporulation protein J (antagonist of Soj) containing ParB-like nuclease domain [Candidatus Pelagibacterales bacterium]|jgi:ParB family chromosome partitioning protein
MIGNKFKGLGKGLSALMGDVPPENIQTKSSSEKIPIHFVYANPSQPRKNFNQELLNELSESIKEQGIIQPILVRKKSEDKYEIVAGERRWRAAQLAKIHEVPVIILNIDDKKSLEFAILENIQRSDLNGIEEALGYDNLVKKFGYSQETLSKILGKSRSHIANTLRLAGLPEEIKKMISDGLLTSGHARCLVNVPDNIKLAKIIVNKNLSVRQAEFLVKKEQVFSSLKKIKTNSKDTNIKSLESDLGLLMGIKVDIKNKKNNSGDIKFSYKNLDQLNKIISVLKGYFR